MASLTRSVACLAFAGAVACATSNRPTTSTGPARWTGSFKMVSGSSAVLSRTTDSQGSASGNISVANADSVPPTSHVDLTVALASLSSRQLAWAIFHGPCGSPTPPVAGLQEFPPIDVTSGGAHVAVDLRFRLAPGSDYHANVYSSNRATDVSNVLMCTNLSLQR